MPLNRHSINITCFGLSLSFEISTSILGGMTFPFVLGRGSIFSTNFQARSCEWFWGCGLTPLLHETHKKGTKTRQYAIKRLKILLKKVQNYGFTPPLQKM